MHQILPCFYLIFSLLMPSTVFAAPTKYYVPPSHFNAAFQIMDMGMANILGLFQEATGSFAFDDSTKTLSHLKIAINSSSLTVAHASEARELASLLEINEFPEIVFMATAETAFKDGRAAIKGTLTIHGVSNPATFEGTLNFAGARPFNPNKSSNEVPTVGLSLKGSFKRADFGMGDEPEVPGRFGETMTLMLEMQTVQP